MPRRLLLGRVCPPGRAPTWGNHTPAMHDYQGGTQAGLRTAPQSLSRKVLGRSLQGPHQPGGGFPDTCMRGKAPDSSPAPTCSPVFSLPAALPIRARSQVRQKRAVTERRNETAPLHLCAATNPPSTPRATSLATCGPRIPRAPRGHVIGHVQA